MINDKIVTFLPLPPLSLTGYFRTLPPLGQTTIKPRISQSPLGGDKKGYSCYNLLLHNFFTIFMVKFYLALSPFSYNVMKIK
jgi:hypothetical protein